MNDTGPRPAPAETGPPHDEAGAWLTVDLGALAANWRALRDVAQGAECAAVVKADAYGLGIEQAVPALARAGCRTFFVAHLGEAARVRAASPDADIYVLNGFLPGTGRAFGSLRVRPVLGSREEVEEWAQVCAAAGTSLPAALHVDTGMSRLGLRPEEAMAMAPALPLRPALLMSHLVTAEDPGDPVNRLQVEAFAAVRRAFPGVPSSLANSSGIHLPEFPHPDMVRPGYALYGGNPTPNRPNPMRPVVRLEARVIQLRRVEAGETVGYNGQWTADRPSRIATLSVGYADGYPRAASATDARRAGGQAAGEATVAGIRCPFAGRVSMDLVTLDVSEVPEGMVRRGDPVTLIGDGLDIDEVGRRAGTIGYEILTGLGSRYARRYLG